MRMRPRDRVEIERPTTIDGWHGRPTRRSGWTRGGGARLPRARRAAVAGVLAVGTLAAGAPAAAQETVTGARCSGRAELIGDLGIQGLSCNCTYYTGEEGAPGRWRFRSEPEIEGIAPGSAAAGRLRVGDRIVSIDGMLITTGEAGRRFAAPPPDEEVRLTVRRDGETRTVTLRPEPRCSDSGELHVRGPAVEAVTAPAPPRGLAVEAPSNEGAPPAVPAAETPPTPRAAGVSAAPRVATGVPVSRLLPGGWFGFGIQCSECAILWDEEAGRRRYEFSEPPAVSSVQPGSPADRAGIRRGDLLLAIDGEPLTSDAGADRFAGVEPGESVGLRIRRDATERTVRLTAEERPEVVVARAAPPKAPAPAAGVRVGTPAPDEYGLRYAGTVGNAEIEVRAAGSVVVDVIEPGREVEIRTGDSRTRIRLAPPPKQE